MSLQVPRQELPPDEWFTIKSIVRDLELHERQTPLMNNGAGYWRL